MWLPGLIGRNRELDETITVTGGQDPFLGGSIGKLLPIVEIPTAYFMNADHIETVTASAQAATGAAIAGGSATAIPSARARNGSRAQRTCFRNIG